MHVFGKCVEWWSARSSFLESLAGMEPDRPEGMAVAVLTARPCQSHFLVVVLWADRVDKAAAAAVWRE